MSLALIHISDIHIEDSSDPIMERVDAIASAVAPELSPATDILLIITGDIVQSGLDSQYLVALDFVTNLREEIKKRTGRLPQCFVVPGNHDCDFTRENAARTQALAGKALERRVDDESLNACLEVQTTFFSFASVIAPEVKWSSRGLVATLEMQVEGRRVVVSGYNTSWCSQRPESRGNLAFHPSDYPEVSPADCSISVCHHPYYWQIPSLSRKFKRQIETSSDLVLTGHEHEQEHRLQSLPDGSAILTIEGRALQERRDKAESGFNLALVDVVNSKAQVLEFNWTGHLYQLKNRQAKETEFYSQARRSMRFGLSKSFVAELNDLGLSIEHPTAGRLDLSKIYVAPDLGEVTYRPKEETVVLRGDRIPEYLKDHRRIIISSADKAGKTALAKQIVIESHAEGLIPLLIQGEDLKFRRGADRLMEALEEIFLRQYDSAQADAYRQLSPSRRVLVIDNFHECRLARGDRDALLVRLQEIAHGVVLIADDLTQQIQEIAGAAPATDSKEAFPHFRIRQFGHLLRSELAEKWLLLYPELAANPDALSRKLNEIRRVMTTALGRNFVPSYPVFILPILQAQAHAAELNLTASTFGYFYELLIRRDLYSSGGTKEGYDVKLGYLAYLAFTMFERGSRHFSDKDLRDCHANYEKTYLLSVDFCNMVNGLMSSGMLRKEDDVYVFRYAYIYYYFVAYYINLNIHSDVVKTAVRRLTAELHVEEHANILLFLAHLSREPYVIDLLLASARRTFADAPIIRLESGDSPLVELRKVLGEIEYVEGEAHKGELVLQQMDARLAAAPGDMEGPEGGELAAYLRRVTEAFRTMQILGQIAKNFPGSMDGATKKAITLECYNVGLRVLGSLFEELRGTAREMMHSFVEELRQEEPDIEREELAKVTRMTFEGLVFNSAFALVRRIARSVGSQALIQVYEAILAEDPSPAKGLIAASLKMEQSSRFPGRDIEEADKSWRGNELAERIIRGLVVSHFYLYDERFDVKQRVCDKLGISYKRLQVTDPRMKLERKR